MPYTIDLKHKTKHRTWKRLSVVTLVPDRLVADLVAHIAQYAKDNNLEAADISGRVVEIDSSQIGSRDVKFKALIHAVNS